MSEDLFYPCVSNTVTGRIDVPCTSRPMTYAAAREWLEAFRPHEWQRCDARPVAASLIEADAAAALAYRRQLEGSADG